ncbi:DUF1173 family protein [Duganella sp. FT92W]|uniref:DUF1173 family protein n=1 Tax=Pseudoduganella rivuli TaxID=2666085 RepID=A0A7X2IIE1_9BURK|nr:DUF1173 family protein [Pseudoduganella rivuli]MRV70611.1 DUF1173 family protein [Pseudoduganella rivuli]
MDTFGYLIRGRRYSTSDPCLQQILAQVYDTPERPRCMCVADGVEMYIAKHRFYVIKRMPGTGALHHPTCESFEPDASQSGLALLGDAVIEHGPGEVELRVDFAMARAPGRPVPHGEPGVLAEVNAPKCRMSLRALAQYLFHRAGFNRWTPAMAGKRHQGVIEKYLMGAACEIRLKGASLADRLYVPEPFNDQAKAAIAERRREKLAALCKSDECGGYNMALIIGEFKSAEVSAIGVRLWIKHMPDMPLLLDAKTWNRFTKNFGWMLELRSARPEAQLRVLFAGVVYARQEHTFHIDTATLMLASANWVPLDGAHEIDVVQRLTLDARRFIKPLRFDANSGVALPNFLLLDTGPVPTALHIASDFMGKEERKAKEKCIAAGGDADWSWLSGTPMPPFPPSVFRPVQPCSI